VGGQVADEVADARTCILTVGEVTAYVKRLLDRDEVLSDLLVRGEVSNLRRPASGHIYFSLKDDQSVMDAVCFRGRAGTLDFEPTDGMAVVCGGNVTVYEKQGRYQLVIRFMRPDGMGELAAALEKLKAQLDAEGLFAAERKRALPRFPRLIALVTSATGAAVRDMISILTRRYPLARLLLVPTVVQGEEAAGSIVASLRAANEAGADLIILGRGGGSLEDLWPFNEEAVARAVFGSRAPTISAVGHETDTVLTDFVADLRAATPSHAAEMAVPDIGELHDYLGGLSARATRRLGDVLRRDGERLLEVASHPVLQRPGLYIDTRLQELDDTVEALGRAAERYARSRRERLERTSARLAGTDPAAVLRRGYAIKSEFVRQLRERLVVLLMHPALRHPGSLLAGKRARLAAASRDLAAVSGRMAQSGRRRLDVAGAQLAALDPHGALRRGYSIVRRGDDGRLVSRTGVVAAGDAIAITVSDGDISAEVSETIPREEDGQS
jgi:exodeoxyribonuclease VII large subunit